MGGSMVKRYIFFLGTCGLLAIAYNNCSPVQYTSSPTESSQDRDQSAIAIGTNNSNGAGYDGKPTIFEYYDAANACQDLKINGSPLPNAQIRATAQKVSLIRESCQDIDAVELAPNQYLVNLNGDLVYANRSFSPQSPSEFQVANADCPPGMQPIAGAVRANAFAASIEMDDLSVWDPIGGSLSSVLQGSYSGLPAFELTRLVDASGTPEYRLQQSTDFQGDYYVLSVFAKASTSGTLKIDTYSDNPTTWGMVVFDLASGAVVSNAEINLQVSYAAQPVGDGFLLSFYFRTIAPVATMSTGFAAGDLTPGSSVVVAAPRLENVASFCQ